MADKDTGALRAFGEIPGLIKDSGRVVGFERMRDITLERWEELSARMNPYSVLKLAIESDRHAMFSQLAEEKTKAGFDRSYYDKFQNYLAGNVDIAPVPELAAGGLAPVGDDSGGSGGETDETEDSEETT